MSFKYHTLFNNNDDNDADDNIDDNINNDENKYYDNNYDNNDDTDLDNEVNNMKDNSMNLWKNFLTTQTVSTYIPELSSNFIGDIEEFNEKQEENEIKKEEKEENEEKNDKNEIKNDKKEEKNDKNEEKNDKSKEKQKEEYKKGEYKKDMRKVKTDNLEDIESDIENEIDDIDTEKLDIREYLDLIYRKLLDIDCKVGNRKNIKDVILEKCRIDFVVAKQYLHIKDLHGDILLFKEIYINHVKKSQYPIKFGKNKKLQYWKDGQWNDDNKDCAYLEHVISKNIQSCYIDIVNDETISREEFIACQNHIYKFNEQPYRSQLMAKIKQFFIGLENN